MESNKCTSKDSDRFRLCDLFITENISLPTGPTFLLTKVLQN